jgi:hypothetical protein
LLKKALTSSSLAASGGLNDLPTLFQQAGASFLFRNQKIRLCKIIFSRNLFFSLDGLLDPYFSLTGQVPVSGEITVFGKLHWFS